MELNLTKTICETRILIGYLGEKKQANWWDTSFLSDVSQAFLKPVFPKSTFTAQYTGVCRAASIIHDEHIGIGKHYHLYRLPDSIEKSLFNVALQDREWASDIKEHINNKDTAIDRLLSIAGEPIELSEGPVVVGDFTDKDLDELIRNASSYYVSAFKKGAKTFPYMRCA
jgi:hypothetical protein